MPDSPAALVPVYQPATSDVIVITSPTATDSSSEEEEMNSNLPWQAKDQIGGAGKEGGLTTQRFSPGGGPAAGAEPLISST